jgi:hypothetical protein
MIGAKQIELPKGIVDLILPYLQNFEGPVVLPPDVSLDLAKLVDARFVSAEVRITGVTACHATPKGGFTGKSTASASSRLRIGVCDFGICWDTSGHKEVSRDQKVHCPAVG